MIKTKQVIVVQAGEEFEVHIAGPDQNMADPTGIIGGATFEFTANEARTDLIRTRAYTTDYPPGEYYGRIREID